MATSTADASIDQDKTYIYRDGGVEPVDDVSGQTVASGVTVLSDPDDTQAALAAVIL